MLSTKLRTMRNYRTRLQNQSTNKFNAKSSTYDGFHYHSRKEANYAAELDIRKRTRPKEVKSWERQVKLALKVNETHICNYYIDFKVFLTDGTIEYVEVKGFETDLWRMKWRVTSALWPDGIPGVEKDAKLVLIK